jgi:hypothetical protein
LALICALVMPGLGLQTSAQFDGLLSPAAVDEAVSAAQTTGQLRSRSVTVNFQRLPATASADNPVEIPLELFPGEPLTAVIDHVESNGLNATSYTGHIAEFGNADGDANQLVLVALDGVMQGTVVTPNGSYVIGLDRQSHIVRHVDPAAFPNDEPAHAQLVPPDLSRPMDASGAVPILDTGVRQDLMVLYSPAARAAAGGATFAAQTAAIQALITQGVAETNLAYQRSGVVFRLRLRHVREIAYADSGALGTDLDRLTNGVAPFNIVPGLRNAYGADLVKLVVNSGDGCGLAWLGGPAGAMAGQSNRGHSVTVRSCITPNYTFGHEIGHNQGNNHAPGDPTGVGAFAYSYGFRRCDPNAPRFRSVMAYACPSGVNPARSLNFSNPAVNEFGAPTGTAAQNNALSLNNTRVIVANWRQETQEIPVTSLWAVLGDRRVGQTAQLWGLVRNDTPYPLTVNDRLWFWTDGPGAGAGEGWVGGVPMTGLAPGATAWYALNWTIPTNATPGAWIYRAIPYNHATGEYRGNWAGPQAFIVLSVAGNVTSLWTVSGAQVGQTIRMWANVANTGATEFPANVRVYFWVSGGGISGEVGFTAASTAHAPGTSAWYFRDHTLLPPSRPGGAYSYWAQLRYLSANGVWRNLSGWVGPQGFAVANAAAYAGNVDQLWDVYRPGTTLTPLRGFAARLWALGRNSGTAAHDANTSVWYYVQGPGGYLPPGPGGPGWVGSVPTAPQASNTSAWRNLDWGIPAAAPLGAYQYYARFYRLVGGVWQAIGPASGWHRFPVAGLVILPDEASESDAETDSQPMALPDPDQIPPPRAGGR